MWINPAKPSLISLTARLPPPLLQEPLLAAIHHSVEQQRVAL